MGTVEMNRRNFLSGLTAAGAIAGSTAASGPIAAAVRCPADNDGRRPLKIEAVELLELNGHYSEEAAVDHQPQVNPLDVYDALRPAPYRDKPDGTREVQYEAIYIRIRTSAGLEGLYVPI